MPREAKAYLYDMRQAAALIADFTTGLDYLAYAADAMVRSAVERQVKSCRPDQTESSQGTMLGRAPPASPR